MRLTRAQRCSASLQELNVNGYAALSVAAVASRAGVNKGSTRQKLRQ